MDNQFELLPDDGCPIKHNGGGVIDMSYVIPKEIEERFVKIEKFLFTRFNDDGKIINAGIDRIIFSGTAVKIDMYGRIVESSRETAVLSKYEFNEKEARLKDDIKFWKLITSSIIFVNFILIFSLVFKIWL